MADKGRLLAIQGDYNIFRDLEFTMSDYWQGPYAAQCQTTLPPHYIGPRHNCGDWTQGAIKRGDAIDVQNARGVKIINNIIHDAGMGLFGGVKAPLLEFYGNIVFYNGGIQTYFINGAWSTKPLGHGVYLQNDEGMDISDNILFGNYNFGLHAFGTETAPMRNMVLDRNISYGHGAPISRRNPNMLVGSGQPTIDGKIRDNHMYRPFAEGGGSNCQFGYFFASSVLNESLTVTGNRCIGGDIGTIVTSYKNLTFTGNHIYSNASNMMYLLQYDSAIPYRQNYIWNNNTYINVTQANGFVNQQNMFTGAESTWRGTFAQWKAKFPTFDVNSTFSQTMPTTSEVFIYPNKYEPGRAHIVVYNWSGGTTVSLDLSSVLRVGDQFEIRNAERMLANSQQNTGSSALAIPLVSGTFTGDLIQINLGNLTPSIPVGHTTAPVMHGSEFATLVLQCRSCD